MIRSLGLEMIRCVVTYASSVYGKLLDAVMQNDRYVLSVAWSTVVLQDAFVFRAGRLRRVLLCRAVARC